MGGLFDRPVLLVVLLIVVILLFGAKRLPDLSRSVGRSLRIFKAETEGLRSDGDAEPAAATTAPPAVAAAAPVVAPVVPVALDAPRYLVDPATGERILAQPVAQPVAQPQHPQG